MGAIEISQVSKRFRVNHERHSDLKGRVLKFGRKKPREDFWALQEMSFEVADGETVGLLGHNGSGKSTLLKCVAGIMQPTTGYIKTVGRMASLLELGAGFHPELTGRENVFMNGQILGLKNRDIEKRFDEIVAFAELEQFIDQQVKHYSSGMYVRLGFAVATNVDPDVLLIDEVLAVGDEAFQRKCLERIRRFQREGRTMMFVSHSPELVRQICDRAVVLDHGEMIDIGPPGESIRTFRESLMRGTKARQLGTGEEVDDQADQRPAAVFSTGEVPAVDPDAAPPPAVDLANFEVRITRVRMDYPLADERDFLVPGDPLRIKVGYHAERKVDDVVFSLNIVNGEGLLVYGVNTDHLLGGLEYVEGDGTLEFSFDRVPLLDGVYTVSIGIHSHDVSTIYDHHSAGHTFQVTNPGVAAGLVALDASVTIEHAADRQVAG
ncbi:MAG: ABC transporter ATP-binding protein [Acidimicrobiales bacterium]